MHPRKTEVCESTVSRTAIHGRADMIDFMFVSTWLLCTHTDFELLGPSDLLYSMVQVLPK